MLMLPLLSAVIALLVSASAALGTPTHLSNPLPLVTINSTNISLQASTQHRSNLTFSSWPAQPYQVPLYFSWGIPDFVILYARSNRESRTVRIQELQEFLEEFRDNIEEKSPIPGYVPRQARQSHIDIVHYTKWTIELNEGLFGYRLPTEVGVLALNELVTQLGLHGPAQVFFSIKERRSTYTYGYLTIEELGGRPLTASSTNGGSDFQTS